MKLVSILLIFVISFNPIRCNSLVKSPWNNIDNILSLILSIEEERAHNLKYDRSTDEWVTECPEVECDYGMYDGDDENCPFCLRGPGEDCGEWSGECGTDLRCQYQSPYSCTGKCVAESEFNSRQKGQSCGYWEGECVEGLKCQIQSDILGLYGEIDGSGICVTNEEFASRVEGEACGVSTGDCVEGLTCVENNFPWFSPVCKNLTKSNDLATTNPEADNGVYAIEIAEDFLDDNGEPTGHLEIEIMSDHDVSGEEALLSLVGKEMETFLGLDFDTEQKILENVRHSIETELDVDSSSMHNGDVENHDEVLLDPVDVANEDGLLDEGTNNGDVPHEDLSDEVEVNDDEIDHLMAFADDPDETIGEESILKEDISGVQLL